MLATGSSLREELLVCDMLEVVLVEGEVGMQKSGLEDVSQEAQNTVTTNNG